jgi:hypothetical protein
MRVEQFVERAEQLIAQADVVIKTKFEYSYKKLVDSGAYHGIRSASLSFFRATFGADHPFYTELDKLQSNDFGNAKGCREILVAAREEMAGGWNATVRGQITAEVFSDFLEMARHLLDEKFKDASAVMIGSVLEEHLRQLCVTRGVDVQFTNARGDILAKKADTMNSDLMKAGVYSGLDQKNITAWLDLRNKAAHGHYDQYTQQQVQLMYQSVADFMARNPS